MDYQPDPDLLSDLPLSLMHIILARVPIRDVVRTSILSREWRYTWATLPRLVLDKECANPEDKSRDELEDCMENIITHVLSRHKGPIHECKISVFFETNSPDIEEWILRLSRNDIKELTLHMGDPDFHLSHPLHSSIYSCEKLTSLELDNCELDLPPSTFKGFLFLRRLSLQYVYPSPNWIESIVANSPLLENFTLFDTCSELRINAPNLKYLTLSGEYKEICMYAPLLAKMSVLVSNSSTRHVQQKRSCSFTNFIGSSTNLEKLSGELYFTKYLSIGIEFCRHTLVFHHLKEIELDDVNFEDIKEISVVAHLIIGAPNLEELKISTNYDLTERYEPSDSDPPNISFGDFGCAPDFTFAKLRFVNMKYVSGFLPEVQLITFLLESSPVLEMMRVVYIDELGAEEVQNLRDELLGCNGASPGVDVYFVSLAETYAK